MKNSFLNTTGLSPSLKPRAWLSDCIESVIETADNNICKKAKATRELFKMKVKSTPWVKLNKF